MKKIIALLLTLIFISGAAGCTAKDKNTANNAGDVIDNNSENGTIEDNHEDDSVANDVIEDGKDMIDDAIEDGKDIVDDILPGDDGENDLDNSDVTTGSTDKNTNNNNNTTDNNSSSSSNSNNTTNPNARNKTARKSGM